MFTKYLHDVYTLVPRVYTTRCCIPFRNARSTSKGCQFRRSKSLQN